AKSELNFLEAGITRGLPEKVDVWAVVVPLADQITGRSKTGLVLVLAAVGAVLLIGCVNLANLLLAQGSARRKEMAIRSAIGASRARLLRQSLVESLVLSTAGGLLGAAIAAALIPFVVRYAPAGVPRLDEVGLDARVLAFTA